MCDKDKKIQKAKEVVELSIYDAKMHCLRSHELALYKIVNLPFWKLWRAKQIANEALGTGLYWCKGLQDGQDRSPKSLCSYYTRMPLWYLRNWSRWLCRRIGINARW